jgi:hypothetical protein
MMFFQEIKVFTVSIICEAENWFFNYLKVYIVILQELNKEFQLKLMKHTFLLPALFRSVS